MIAIEILLELGSYIDFRDADTSELRISHSYAYH
jgi:hypothetical protein